MDETIGKGEIIGGKYRIEGVLGVGAMGIVYAAHHLQLDERVALKVLRSELVAYPDAVKRFTREAQAAAKIKNEHVTRVFDIGELTDGTPYIVMESLEGEDLARWLATRGALRLDEAIAFVLQACEALAEAHVLGIVHRDLKPSNLFCFRRPDGAMSIKVLDFGISKIADLSMSDVGKTSGAAKAPVGSPFYMSPEQMQSAHDVDHRTDIWALGVILFELLTTVVPFGGGSLPEVCTKVATRPPRPLRELRRDLPEEVEATILKCLEKNPDNRFENLAEFAGSLFPFASKGARLSIERIVQVSRKARAMAAKTASENPPFLHPAEGSTMRPLGATVPPARLDSGKLTWVGLGGAAVVALGVVLFWTRPTGNGDHTPPAETALTGKAATQPPPPRPAPIPVESLPKDDEPSAPSPAEPAAQGPAPAASAGAAATIDDGSESKQLRLHSPEQDGTTRERVRTPGKNVAHPSSTALGVDVQRSRPPNASRVLDEVNPYTR
ncbi:MAG TPA: serine/threonine-protein kinase [Polyangiaceae bacterium]|nr:serine/threonine-protein kinase [Polyangiaceae bacterium]